MCYVQMYREPALLWNEEINNLNDLEHNFYL